MNYLDAVASCPDVSRDVADVKESVRTSIAARRTASDPYRHHIVESWFPPGVAGHLADMPFETAALDGISGTREAHNNSRRYFDAAALQRYPVMRLVAEVFQAPDIVADLARTFDAALDGTYLRLEYAQDVDGFWLAPHTDLGVKRFTCLIYLSDGPGHDELGTDIYKDGQVHVGRSPFKPNSAMIFVPGPDTWHGFEKRPIQGIRRSVILNYVSHEWRAKEQLSFPTTPVRCSG